MSRRFNNSNNKVTCMPSRSLLVTLTLLVCLLLGALAEGQPLATSRVDTPLSEDRHHLG